MLHVSAYGWCALLRLSSAILEHQKSSSSSSNERLFVLDGVFVVFSVVDVDDDDDDDDDAAAAAALPPVARRQMALCRADAPLFPIHGLEHEAYEPTTRIERMSLLHAVAQGGSVSSSSLPPPSRLAPPRASLRSPFDK